MPREKHKKDDRKKKAGKKGSQLAIRVDKAERDAFVDLCDRLDTSAAREIRRFMREFVGAHATAAAAVPGTEPAPEPDEAAPAEPELPASTETPRRKARARTATQTLVASPPEAAASGDAAETSAPTRRRAPRKAAE